MRAGSFVWVMAAALLFCLGVSGVSAAAPVAAFNGTPLSGPAPLTVAFTDASAGSPTGWAWFFGDENFKEPWTQMSASAGWDARASHSSVVMPDGSIVLMGGYLLHEIRNDTWRSTDNGASWLLMNESSGWSARSGHSSVAMPDGSIVLMGGYSGDSNIKNDTWRSTDNGASWTQVNASSGWLPRFYHSSVAMPDGSIVLMGGLGWDNKNDVWRSTDNGLSWTRQTEHAGWDARASHSSVAMPEGSIVLMGGYLLNEMRNDTWRSTDNGAMWMLMNGSSGWSARDGHSSVVMPDGSIVLMGGYSYDGGGYKNDTWRSRDNGATWTQMNQSSGWSARSGHSSVAMPDGSIVLMGGVVNTQPFTYKNDVWRVLPVGSPEQSPSHTYNTNGTFNVTLQAYNTVGHNSTRKTGYITVEVGIPPLPGYTRSPTDPDGDGIYEDLNGNGRLDFADVVLYFNQMEWIAANEPVTAFDLNGNGRIDFADIVKLFGEI